jgi:nucleoside-diphosphate-sugar epimerase
LKILVTGARGFTGRHFVDAASEAGHEVAALQSNLKDQQALDHEVQFTAPDAVVHLGAISFVGHADVGAFYEVNVLGTLNLLQALSRLRKTPASVLLSSSANVYGNSQVSPISETQPPAPVNHYATSKLAMEHMARTYADKLPLFFTRPFNYTGPGQAQSFIIPKLVDHFARRAPVVELGNIDVEREFNDVRFVCRSYLDLFEKVTPGDVVNICSGRPVTLKSVIETLGNITGHLIEARVNPAFVRANEIHRLCGDPTKLCSIIGDIESPALDDTLRWMLEQALPARP